MKNNIKDIMEALESLPEEITEEILDIEFVDIVRSNHKREQDPYGKPWPKREKAYDHPINNDTGRLLNSYQMTSNGKNQMSITNTAAYAEYVNNRRPLLPESEIPNEWMEEIEKVVDDFIDDWNKQ
jgi:hypothetical protein